MRLPLPSGGGHDSVLVSVSSHHPSDAALTSASGRWRRGLTSNTPAVALAVAAGLHLAALPDHAREGAVIGAFFLGTAAFQLVAAWLVGLRRIGIKARSAIVAGNLALLTLWGWSRLAGLPLDAHDGPEAVSLLDALAVTAQLIAIAGLCRGGGRRDRRAGVSAGAALLAVALVTGGTALQLLPPTHPSHSDAQDHLQVHPGEPVHPTVRDLDLTPSSEPDHPREPAGELDPCSTRCEEYPTDSSAHHDAEHTHP